MRLERSATTGKSLEQVRERLAARRPAQTVESSPEVAREPEAEFLLGNAVADVSVVLGVGVLPMALGLLPWFFPKLTDHVGFETTRGLLQMLISFPLWIMPRRYKVACIAHAWLLALYAVQAVAVIVRVILWDLRDPDPMFVSTSKTVQNYATLGVLVAIQAFAFWKAYRRR